MQYKALIPVKALQEAKSRLAPYLSLEQRKELVLAMLRHVLLVLRESDIETTVVSSDVQVRAYASQYGAHVFEEERAGHNPALEAAAQRILTQTIASSDLALLTISADLPLLQVDELQDMLKLAQSHEVVLASSQEGTGTNALLVHPPLVIPYLFGPDSLQRYLSTATQQHVATTVYRSHGLSFDIDIIDDLELLQMYAWEYKIRQSEEAYSLPSLA